MAGGCLGRRVLLFLAPSRARVWSVVAQLATCIGDPRDPSRVVTGWMTFCGRAILLSRAAMRNCRYLMRCATNPGFPRLALGKLPASGVGLASLADDEAAGKRADGRAELCALMRNHDRRSTVPANPTAQA